MMGNSRIASPVDKGAPRYRHRAGARTFLSAAAFKGSRGLESRWTVAAFGACCGQECPRSGGGISLFSAIAVLLAAGCAGQNSGPSPSVKTAAGSAAALTVGGRTNFDRVIMEAIAQPPPPFEGEGWEAMSDGKTLSGWRETAFDGHGEVRCQAGAIVLGIGDPFTGINYTNELPTMNYEVALDAMRVSGSDFFCGLT